MIKNNLLNWWNSRSSWNFGNCKDYHGNPITDDDISLSRDEDAANYCNKYYKIPATNQYLSDKMVDIVKNNNTDTMKRVQEEIKIAEDEYYYD